MVEIMDQIFQYYNYDEKWRTESHDIKFYKNKRKEIASYFLITFIDCEKIEEDETLLKDKLSRLENNYLGTINDQNAIKKIIKGLFENNKESSQLDKNTSAIYLLKFKDLKTVERYRNLIYSIEESPNYFKRYILPYTNNQANELKTVISNYKDKNIVEILTDLANNEDEYYSLLDNKNSNHVYELVIRLFSKVPFLQYGFRAEPIPMSIEENIEKNITSDLERYHELVYKNEDISLEQLVELESDFTISDEELEKIYVEIFGGII